MDSSTNDITVHDINKSGNCPQVLSKFDIPLSGHNELKTTENEQKPNIYQMFLKILGINDEGKSPTTNEMCTLILLGSMLLLFIASGTGFFVMWFTQYYNNSMLSELILSKDSETAKQWMQPNPKYDTLLKVHIFNYTNIEEYLSGKSDKIIVDDIGPLTYKEHTTKVNVTFNKNNTVTFRDHREYEFLQDKSTIKEESNIFVPNVPLFSAGVKMEKFAYFKKTFASAAIRALNENTFKRLSAHEYLWGYRDKIVSLDFFSGSTHFGLLRNRNGTSVDSLQINTGVDDLQKFGVITQYNGMPLLDFWEDDECNRIDGTDASMFPPHLIEERNELSVFLSVLCRKVPLQFEKEVTLFNNIEALRYRTPLNVFSHPDENLNNECYCRNTKTCLPSGVINATKCYDGAPIYPSFPHFFSGDPEVYKKFEGINPSADIHQTYADIHPRFAFPIGGASRIQINLSIQKSKLYNDKIQRLDEGTILPLIWIEITTGEFTEDIIDKLYLSTFGLNAIQFVLKYGTLLVSVTSFSLIIAIIFYLQRRREELEMEKETPKEEIDELFALNRPSTTNA